MVYTLNGSLLAFPLLLVVSTLAPVAIAPFIEPHSPQWEQQRSISTHFPHALPGQASAAAYPGLDVVQLLVREEGRDRVRGNTGKRERVMEIPF
jgi:hypothetical protein